MGKGIGRTWKGQRLTDGLPVMTTTFEEEGVRYEVEQFAYPLHGPPTERRGDMAMVLLQRLTLTELNGTPRTLPVSMTHRRQLASVLRRRDRRRAPGRGTCSSERRGRARRAARGRRRGRRDAVERHPGLPSSKQKRALDATVFVDLPAKGSRQFVVKLPSPLVPDDEMATLTAIDYRQGACRDAGVLVDVPRTRRAVPRARARRERSLPRQPVARAPAAASSWRRRGRTSPSTCRTRTSPTARPARRGPSIRPCTWTTCSTTCAATTAIAPKSSRSSSATTRRPTAT